MFAQALLVSLMLLGQADAADADPPDSTEPKDPVTQVTEKGADEISKAAEGLAQGDIAAAWPLIERFVIPGAAAILILLVAYFLANLLARVVSAPIRSRVDETLGRFMSRLVFYAIMVFALLGVLGMFGVSVTSFAAVIAAAGFAIGLAFQGTLSNFAAGILLLVFRPYKVGDVISAAGITAKVFEIDLFTTKFDTPDNRRFIVPNSAIASGTIENISFHQQRRIEVAVGVDYSASLDQTRDVLTAAAESLNEFVIEGEGRGFQIVMGDLGASAVDWKVRFWTKAEDFWPVKEKLTAAVKDHLDQAGIGIPFPQMDVHLDKPA